MADSTTGKLCVCLSASEVRRRLKGHGLGVRGVEAAGKGRAVVIHTATGKHLRELDAFFQGAVEQSSDSQLNQPDDGNGGGK